VTAAAARPTSEAAVGMGAVAAASRLVGFVRVLVIAGVLGPTYRGNAFQSANSLSNVLFELLAAGALSAVLVPVFVELLDEGQQEDAEKVAGAVLGAALLVLGALSVIGVLGAPLLARALTAGVPDAVAGPQRELTTHLLRFFVPQVLLYAAGTVATAVLYARRRFAIAAAAPIGNTVVMVAALVLLRSLTGPEPGFDLSTGERFLLVVAGTGGVIAFVGILLVTCAASGFRLRPRMPRREGRAMEALRHSGWGVALHTGGGLLLGGAIIAGAAVEGGVVAYQVAWVFFLAPYAVLAQPIHTTILPELVGEASHPTVFASSVRWALERMALLVLPVAAGMMALAATGMRVVTFGETGSSGASLIAAALVTLSIGLFPYGAFLLLARAFYALGDSRTPALAALGTSVMGVVVMLVGALVADGTARIAVLGLGHTVAYALGTVWLGVLLTRRIGQSIVPVGVVRIAAIAAVAGAAAWLVASGIAGGDHARVTAAIAAVSGAVVGGAIVLGAYRALRVTRGLSTRTAIAGTAG
jgi:putative peptidoglycan lipid II flippase